MFAVFGHSFRGLSPVAALALALGGSAALVALYLLRERSRRVPVAFMALWRPSPGARKFERLGRRLRHRLSLLLQLVLFLLVVVALADPRPAATSAQARTWLVLVDRSASMSAREGDSNRLSIARDKARKILASLADGEPAMVASFAGSARAEAGFGTNVEAMEAAVDRIEPSEEPADFGRALTFAAAALRGRPRPTLVIVSDGQQAEATDASADLSGVDVRSCPVGSLGDNVALLAFSARRRAGDPGTVDLGLVVQNFGATRRKLAVQILAGRQRRPVLRLPLDLGPGQRVARSAAPLFTAQAELEARLLFEGAAGSSDHFPLDDRAFAVVPARPRRRVLVVGTPNLYLEGALVSLGDSVAVSRVGPGEAEKTRDGWPDFDAVVFDRTAPAPPPAAGRFVYLDPHGPGSPFAAAGLVRDPVVSDADRRHPLLAHMALADLNIRHARRLVLTPDDRAVTRAFGTPLLVTRVRPGLKVVALSFDVRRSDLPLRPSFPLLLANALDWLGDGADEAAPSQRTGQVARVPVTGAQATVVGPNGQTARRSVALGVVEVPLAQQGFYRVVAEGARGAVSVLGANLASAVESDTRRPARLDVAGRPVATWEPPPRTTRADFATFALAVAAALSLFEWWSHQRRWTV